MTVPPLRVYRDHPLAHLPQRGSAGAAGYDLFSVEDAMVFPGLANLVSTGIKIQVPEGYYGRVAPRSGLAVKNCIDVGAGVIDSDFRGVVKVVLFNLGEERVKLAAGSRVAQLILEKITTPPVVEMGEEDFNELTSTRGEGGFGSTGL